MERIYNLYFPSRGTQKMREGCVAVDPDGCRIFLLPGGSSEGESKPTY